ncbi:MAG: hypothetical protein IJK23_01095 [Clostridia bacterium]|nr:hypothetical protein [Clostridia bacterium]
MSICMIAHRGYSGAFPMNTELAFREAARHHSGGAETDIRRTRDGVYVCSHDAEARFADGTELIVEENDFAALTAKPLKNDKTDDAVYLCTLKRYLEVMRDNDMICFVELKGPFTDAQVKEVFDLVAEVYDLKKCILQSFDFDNLLKAHEQFPALPLMWTYGTGESHYERCFEHGFSIDVDRVVVTEQMVKDFHDHGLEVGVWTVNDAQELARISALGVDYIESDVFGG